MGRCFPSCSWCVAARRRARAPCRQAVERAHAEFNHTNEVWHGIELCLSAVNVICLVLSMSKLEDEIPGAGVAQKMVYRARREAVVKSYPDKGAALVPLLLHLPERCK